MLELALHVLDILQNAVEAGAQRVALTIEEDLPADRLTITVEDNGRGMDAGTASRVTDPFSTSRKTRHVGLGLPLYAEAAESAGGALVVKSAPGIGTKVTATLRHSHPDRQPLGDMGRTLLAFLLAPGCPELHYTHLVIPPAGEMRTFELDTTEVRAELRDVPLSHPAVMAWLGRFLNEGESSLWESHHA